MGDTINGILYMGHSGFGSREVHKIRSLVAYLGAIGDNIITSLVVISITVVYGDRFHISGYLILPKVTNARYLARCLIPRISQLLPGTPCPE